MSTSESKKTKRRKIKNAVTKSSASSNVFFSNGSNGLQLTVPPCSSNLLDGKEGEEKFEQLIKGNEDLDLQSLPTNFFLRGPNPFIMKEHCLLCECERIDPPEAAKIKSGSDDVKNTDSDVVPKLPLWVCQDCRKAADSELINKKHEDIPFLDQDLQPEAIPFPFDINLESNEPTTPNGTKCYCEACKERRQIADEFNKETQELQKSWVELRKIILAIYNSDDPYLSEADSIHMRDLVIKLCSRDPHQLFLRLESQIRDFVIEKRVRLNQQLSKGYSSLCDSQLFIHMFLEEYSQLCRASRVASDCLADLKDHLKRFHVTWELHNKYLFQNIVYSHPAIHHKLPEIRETLRKGVSEENDKNDYPNLLCRFLKLQEEMSVILAVWRDCQSLIDSYNEEQTALKVKQKWLKEDWEFFKAQRKLLEQQVLKNPKAPPTNTHTMEAQFTETMRNLLQGTRPSVEDCHCPRCNRKRCPCDECTITHMITCGIINPDTLEHDSSPHTFNFPHDPNFPPDSSNYLPKIRPPSVSSTNSSSGSVSPIIVDRERLVLPFECPVDFENTDDIPEEIVEDSQSEDSDDELDEDDEDDDDDDEEEEDGSDGFDIQKPGFVERGKSGGSTHTDLHTWMAEQTEVDCDCHHCVQPKAEEIFQEPYPCQCHLCLPQPTGHLLNSALPQHVPLSPRATDLHIYPHIHGYPGLHGIQTPHPRSSILTPQLYDLHTPLPQGKLADKIDFDTSGAMQEHLYPAFGDWDNDPHGLLGSHQYTNSFPSDLLPPPPLTASNPFITDPSMLSTQTAPPPASAFKSVSHLHSQNPDSSHTYEAVHFDACPKTTSCSTSNAALSQSSSIAAKNPGPPCMRPVTLGGNSNVATSVAEKPFNQHCLKHNHQVEKSSSSGRNQNQSRSAAHNLPPDPTHIKTKEESSSTKSRNSIPGGGGGGGGGVTCFPHSCSHCVKGQKPAPHPPYPEGHPTCPNVQSLPTSMTNVSVGTSTLCAYPDCEGNHDDNCDSIDDTCSDKSSSTSSNQKEGKYCDCCYCEFFGHGNQPVSQSNKKYSEMKEKLRRRLNKKSETRSDENSFYQHTCQKQKEEKGLEELIKYINGVDNKSKSTKKQRQKQRKVEEKLKQEEKEERKKKKAERKLRKKPLVPSGKPEYIDRSETVESRESPTIHKHIKKITKVESSSHDIQAPSSATPPSQCPKQQATPKSQSSKLKEESSRKLTSSPTTPVKEPKDNNSTTRPQTPKPQSQSQQQQQQQPSKELKKGKRDSKLSKSDSRDSPVPDSSAKHLQAPVKVTISSELFLKSAQSTNKSSLSNKPSTNQPEVNKASSSAQIKVAANSVVAPASARDSKNNASDNKKKKGETQPQAKPNGVLQNQSQRPSSQPSSGKPIPSSASGKKTPTTNQKTNQKVPTTPQNKAGQLDTNTSSNPKHGQQGSSGLSKHSTTNKSNSKQEAGSLKDESIKTSQSTNNPPPNHPSQQSMSKQQVNPAGTPKSKRRETNAPQNGFVPTVNGDLTNSQKTQLKSNPLNGLSTNEKKTVPEPVAVKSGKNKNKKKKKKTGKGDELDEIFLPRSESDIENGDLDDTEKEIEDFKRFCLGSPQPPVREKMQVNINVKDIHVLSKKKLGLGCN